MKKTTTKNWITSVDSSCARTGEPLSLWWPIEWGSRPS